MEDMSDLSAPLGFAVVGCGYVADFYLATYRNYPQLKLFGAMDRDQDRARAFGNFHGVPIYATLDELLADERVAIVVNLTNPGSHYEVSNRALRAGKHVYSEKPLALELDQARALVELAAGRRLMLASAPCSLLGEVAQTIWHLIRTGAIGKIIAVYANIEDGAKHLMGYRAWRSVSGAPWPYADEFELGGCIEHANYYLTWLTAFFGRVECVTALSACLAPDKLPEDPARPLGPDFSVSVLRFASGTVARLSVGTLMPQDHQLVLVGERGVIYTDDSWNYGGKVSLRDHVKPSLENKSVAHIYLSEPRAVPLVRPDVREFTYHDTHDMDFARGVAELADAILEGRRCRMGADWALHLTETLLGINAATDGMTFRPQTTFAEIEPMPWAR